MGIGCMGAGLAYAAHGGVPLAILGAQGGGRLSARGRLHLRGSREAALGDDWSQTPAWWPQQSRLKCAERGASPGCASIGWKIISTKSAPGRRPEPAHGARWCCGKTVLNFSPSSRMVHQHAPTTRDPDPKNFWHCCSWRLTRGCQVCRTSMGMQGGQGNFSRRGTRRAWEMTPASRGRLTRHTPSPIRTFRRAKTRASVLSGAPTE